MKPGKTLAVISTTGLANEFLLKTVKTMVGNRVKIFPYTIDEGLGNVFQTDVVLVSGHVVKPEVEPYFPHSVIVVPKRMITGYNLHKLMILPKGKELLVIGHPKMLKEKIRDLKELGINHLKFIPYNTKKYIDITKYDTAVTTGEMFLCPDKIKNVIDLGPRGISYFSALELLIALELDLRLITNLMNLYTGSFVQSGLRLSNALGYSEALRKYQEIVLDEMNDGLLSVDSNGKIEYFNESAINILSRTKEQLNKRDFGSVRRRFKPLSGYTDDSKDGSKSTGIFFYEGKHLIISKIQYTDDNDKKDIYVFREISQIQDLEKNVRMRLAEKGYVTKYSFSDILTLSIKLMETIKKATVFAKTDKNILITGESGTGKELFAHAIHNESLRKTAPFVAINFAGIPENLVESELFGYEEGAFTGAKKGGKAGLFEQAHGGTLFLDEIGDAPFHVQSRLLRVLQEKEIMKVGGSKIIPVDVRIIAATNANLHDAIKEKSFRKDLFYRLNVLPIEILPLRERKEDILHIFEHVYLGTFRKKKPFTSDAIQCILNYDWPGNVRELISTAEYCHYSSLEKDTHDLDSLPPHICTYLDKTILEDNSAEDSDLSFYGFDDHDIHMIGTILSTLNNHTGLIGRNSLLRIMNENGVAISEGILKKYLRILKTRKFICVGKTKQGSTISSNGKRFLSLLKRQDLQLPL